MLSPRFVNFQSSTNEKIDTLSMSEMSMNSPVMDDKRIFYQNSQPNLPNRIYESIMPPPPHNMIATISNNNNNVVKNYNRNNTWYHQKRIHRDGKNDKRHATQNSGKQMNEKNEFQKRMPDNRSTKSYERTDASQTIVHQHFYPNTGFSETQINGHNNNYTYISQNYQQNGFFNNNNNKHRHHHRQDRPNNKHKRSIPLSPYSHFSLVDTLMDRFLARAELVEIRNEPQKLLTGSEWDKLSLNVWETFINHQQTEETYKRKLMLWKDLYTFIRSVYPRYGLFVVGSTMCGLGLDSSDVDMCLLVRASHVDQRTEALHILDQIQHALTQCDFIDHAELIWAKVPILKFHDTYRHLDVDLNCNNSVGIRNTHLLHCYSNADWRVRPLVQVVKLWARANNINDAKNMTISSYSLALMVIHYLQCGVAPPVVPCLHGLYPGKFCADSDIHLIDMQEQLHPFHSDNNQTLGELLLGFLNYYANFNYTFDAISVRLGSRIPIDECRLARSHKNDPHQWKLLCIEEPFDLSNTARSVYDVQTFERIKTVFAHSYKRLQDRRELLSIFTYDDIEKL